RLRGASSASPPATDASSEHPGDADLWPGLVRAERPRLHARGQLSPERRVVRCDPAQSGVYGSPHVDPPALRRRVPPTPAAQADSACQLGGEEDDLSVDLGDTPGVAEGGDLLAIGSQRLQPAAVCGGGLVVEELPRVACGQTAVLRAVARRAGQLEGEELA